MFSLGGRWHDPQNAHHVALGGLPMKDPQDIVDEMNLSDLLATWSPPGGWRIGEKALCRELADGMKAAIKIVPFEMGDPRKEYFLIVAGIITIRELTVEGVQPGVGKFHRT
jgi:hypothetical protein